MNTEQFNIQIEPDDNEIIDLDVNTEIDNNKDNKNKKESSKSVSKTAIITGIIGFILIVGALAIANRINKRDEYIDTSDYEVSYREARAVDSSIDTNEWVKFKQDNTIEIINEQNSKFKVTNISHYVKIINENKDIILKSIISGEIDGLEGTFEIEMPYEKAKFLEIGSVFNIKYKYGIKNGVRVIGEIEY